MIPASEPIVTQTYDTWTVVALHGERVEAGRFLLRLTLHRSRVIDPETGNTELYPDQNARRILSIGNIYAPPYLDAENPSLGEWWTAELRAAVIAWAAAGVQAAASVGHAMGAL